MAKDIGRPSLAKPSSRPSLAREDSKIKMKKEEKKETVVKTEAPKESKENELKKEEIVAKESVKEKKERRELVTVVPSKPPLTREPSETPSVKDLAKKIDHEVRERTFSAQDSFSLEPNGNDSVEVQILKDEIIDLQERLESLR